MLILSKKIIKRKKEKIFYNHYKNIFFKALENLRLNDLEKISKIIEKKIIQKKNIFVAGNGGSASVANHFLCDFNKGIKLSSKKKMMPKVISLSNSIELITAISNDIKYEKIFSFQLENYANKNDLLIFLISGGASSLLVNPIDGLTLKEKQKINSLLLKSGATISEINAVRKHLSLVKGGKLIKYAYPAKVLTLAISDVPGDDLGVIGSGPTYPDESTRNDALKVLNKYNIKFSNKIKSILNNSNNETPNFKDKVFKNSNIKLIAKPQDALNKAAKTLASYGFKSMVLSDSIEGESEDIGIAHGAIAKQVIKYNQPKRAPLCILSGGETTVTVNNANGKGGRNTQFLLSLAIYLNSIKDIYAIACDTDGIDGSEENAGAIIYPNTLKRANKLGLNANKFLKNNDAYTFFQKLGDLVVTGPTNTNVNDFRAIIII